MQDIYSAAFMKQTIATIDNMYRLGWDERNGGNISYRLTEAEVSPYVDLKKSLCHVEMAFDASALSGCIFLVTGTGKYFKNVSSAPEENLGILRIDASGMGYDILWGYKGGGRPTSELPAHLMSHIERLKNDPDHRIIMHCHATNTLAMTYVHCLDEREFTRTLWQMCTECIVVFPDGVSVLPWMLCGKPEIGRATAEKMKQFRLVVWAQHGIFGAGKDLDETFGLIETVEKAAEIFIKTLAAKRINSISDQQLRVLSDAFGVKVREGFLD